MAGTISRMDSFTDTCCNQVSKPSSSSSSQPSTSAMSPMLPSDFESAVQMRFCKHRADSISSDTSSCSAESSSSSVSSVSSASSVSSTPATTPSSTPVEEKSLDEKSLGQEPAEQNTEHIDTILAEWEDYCKEAELQGVCSTISALEVILRRNKDRVDGCEPRVWKKGFERVMQRMERDTLAFVKEWGWFEFAKPV